MNRENMEREIETAPCGYDHCGANCRLCPLNFDC